MIEENKFTDLAGIRKSQEDPIVQYYIVNKDLDMTPGKIAAQVAHGAQMFLSKYFEIKQKQSYPIGGKYAIYAEICDAWFLSSFRKVVLTAKKKDFDRVKELLDVFLVVDAGLTQVESGSETVLVSWPMLKSKQPDVLKKLRVL